MKYWENPEAILSIFRQRLPNLFRGAPVAILLPLMATSSPHRNRYNFVKRKYHYKHMPGKVIHNLPYLLLPKNHPKV